MDIDDLRTRDFEREFVFSTSRSSGPGGQNVNKVNTRVELRINIRLSSLFTDEEKEIITVRLKGKINKAGELIIISQAERSQSMNRKAAEEKFYKMIEKALSEPAERIMTQSTVASKRRRLEDKRIRGLMKRLRRDGELSSSSE
jgi:ribosome-associated protein